jgi:hypothetical protein
VVNTEQRRSLSSSASPATTPIAAAVADLPAEAGVEDTDKAEAALIGYAGQFEPAALGRIGTRILAHVACRPASTGATRPATAGPDIAERAEAKKLESMCCAVSWARGCWTLGSR